MGSLLDVCACSNKYENIATDCISLCEGEDRENRCGCEKFQIPREIRTFNDILSCKSRITFWASNNKVWKYFPYYSSIVFENA